MIYEVDVNQGSVTELYGDEEELIIKVDFSKIINQLEKRFTHIDVIVFLKIKLTETQTISLKLKKEEAIESIQKEGFVIFYSVCPVKDISQNLISAVAKFEGCRK